MKNILLASIIALAIPFPAHASSADPGFVKFVQPLTTGTLLFQQTGARTSRPACATFDRWAIDTSTSAGQAAVATLLSAYALGKKIIVVGTGTCSAYGDTETVLLFQTQD